jgi:hypothetical protein
MNRFRLFLGFLVAPLALPLSLVLMRLLKAQGIGLGYESDAFEGDIMFLGLVAYVVMAGLIITLMIGLSILKLTNDFSCSIAGLSVWFVLTFLLPPHYDSPIPDIERLGLAISCSIGGALTSLVFWIIACWKPAIVRNKLNAW